MAMAWDKPGVISAGTRLSVIAPIDDGRDAEAVGDRLLCATPSLLEHCRDVQTFDLTWRSPVVLGNRRVFGLDDQRAFRGHVGAYRSALVLAASYCAHGCCCGFGLWHDDGAIWICWTPRGREFDAWLRDTIPEFQSGTTRH